MRGAGNIHEYGIVLVLFAIFMAVVISFMAIVIDGSLMRLSAEEAQHHARLTALSAIEGYFRLTNTDCGEAGCTHDQRLEAALNRAREIAGVNFLSANSNIRPSLQTFSGDKAAMLEAGRWESDVQKCGNYSKSAPCFLPLSYGEEGPSHPNAFRVSGPFYSSIESKLAQIVGMKQFSTEIYATATVTPRRICFLVDVSGSTVFSTHSLPDRYVYHLQDGAVMGSEAAGWNRLQEARDGKPDGHFQSDYTLKASLDDTLYSGISEEVRKHHPHPDDINGMGGTYRLPPAGASGTWVKIDTVVNPEPLRTIFFGIHEAVKTLKERSVSGDKACLIVYDDRLTWPRIVNITDDFDYLLQITDFGDRGTVTGDAGPGDALSFSSNFERAIRHGLFPSHSSYTVSYLAVKEALKQFVEDAKGGSGIPTADSIVMLTDGLHNCTHSSGTFCNNNVYTHSDSAWELLTLASRSLAPQAVAAHIMLVGSNVRPHTFNIASDIDPTRCMTDREYRAKYAEHQNMYGFVSGQWNCDDCDIMSPDPLLCKDCPDYNYYNPPYSNANQEMYPIAAITQGIWAPLRPAPPDCSPYNYQAECIPGEIQDTDPLCRPMRAQVVDYVKEILGENPYTLVELGAR